MEFSGEIEEWTDGTFVVGQRQQAGTLEPTWSEHLSLGNSEILEGAVEGHALRFGGRGRFLSNLPRS